jgi:hypothetical protein
MKLYRTNAFFYLSVFLLGILLLVGCGGGTSGTDAGGSTSFRSTISGALEDEAGNGISKASILLENTDDRTTTANDGSFEISAVISSEPLALTVRTTSGQGGSVDIGTLSPDAPNAVVILILDQSGNIRVRSIQISPLPTPTPGAGPPAEAPTPPLGPTTPPPTPRPISEASLQIEVTVVEPNNSPIPNMQVSIGSLGAETNSAGLAALAIRYRGGPIRINLALGDFRGFSVVGRLPIEDALVRITLEAQTTESVNSPNGCSPAGGGAGRPKPGCRLKAKTRDVTRVPRG